MLSECYRSTIGLDSQIVAIGAIGPLSDTIGHYRADYMLVQYRTVSDSIGLSDTIGHYRTIGAILLCQGSVEAVC